MHWPLISIRAINIDQEQHTAESRQSIRAAAYMASELSAFNSLFNTVFQCSVFNTVCMGLGEAHRRIPAKRGLMASNRGWCARSAQDAPASLVAVLYVRLEALSGCKWLAATRTEPKRPPTAAANRAIEVYGCCSGAELSHDVTSSRYGSIGHSAKLCVY
ncbi:hypothetical protein L1887_61130 [Cichorium endivia]|nr:hypothetical protein L1887_61130 [Cichorium endivia]